MPEWLIELIGLCLMPLLLGLLAIYVWYKSEKELEP